MIIRYKNCKHECYLSVITFKCVRTIKIFTKILKNFYPRESRLPQLIAVDIPTSTPALNWGEEGNFFGGIIVHKQM